MGWTFMNKSFGKNDLVTYLLAPSYWGEGYTVLGHSVVGNHLWVAVRHTTDKRDRIKAGDGFIFLALMESGHPHHGWGYKDLDEAMQPCAVDCPLSLLKLAGPPRTEGAAAWREAVRKHHARRKEARVMLAPGQVLTVGGTEYRLVSSLGRKGWVVDRVSDGARFRMPAQQANRAARAVLRQAEAA